ncbi:RhoGEF domain containing protein [Balamuthia mandrillaris]
MHYNNFSLPDNKTRNSTQKKKMSRRGAVRGSSSLSSSLSVSNYLLRELALKKWLTEVLQDSCKDLALLSSSQTPLQTLLKDGTILCHTMLKLKEGSIPRVHPKGAPGFKQRENIMFFLQALQHELHFPSHDLFAIGDLYESNNFLKVLTTLEVLADTAVLEFGCKTRLLSPQEMRAEEEKRLQVQSLSFEEADLKRASAVLSLCLPNRRTSVLWRQSKTMNEELSTIQKEEKEEGKQTLQQDAIPPQRLEQLSPESAINSDKEVATNDSKQTQEREQEEAGAEFTVTKHDQGVVEESNVERKAEEEGATKNDTDQSEEVSTAAEVELSSKEKRRETGRKKGSRRKRKTKTDNAFSVLSLDEKEKEIFIKGITRLQAYCRGSKVRAMYRLKVRNAAYRENVAREILKTEEDYVNNLNLVFDVFLKPLRARLDEAKNFKALLADLNVIRNYNQELLESLGPRVLNWTPNQQLGDIFVRVGFFLKAYTQYVSKYHKAMEEITEMKKSSLALRDFLEECCRQPKVGGKDLASFLIQPVQRIPRYRLLLKDLLKHTEKDHKDYSSLLAASVQITEVAEYVEKKSTEAENITKVLEIQSKLFGKFENLARPSRKFVKEGMLNVWNLEKQKKKKRQPVRRVLFLFNDLLVEASPPKKTKDSTTAYKFQNMYTLHTLTPENLPDDPKLGFGFALYALKGERVVELYAPSDAIRQEWVKDLSAVKQEIENRHKELSDIKKQVTQRRVDFYKRSLALRYEEEQQQQSNNNSKEDLAASEQQAPGNWSFSAPTAPLSPLQHRLHREQRMGGRRAAADKAAKEEGTEGEEGKEDQNERDDQLVAEAESESEALISPKGDAKWRPRLREHNKRMRERRSWGQDAPWQLLHSTGSQENVVDATSNNIKQQEEKGETAEKGEIENEEEQQRGRAPSRSSLHALLKRTLSPPPASLVPKPKTQRAKTEEELEEEQNVDRKTLHERKRLQRRSRSFTSFKDFHCSKSETDPLSHHRMNKDLYLTDDDDENNEEADARKRRQEENEPSVASSDATKPRSKLKKRKERHKQNVEQQPETQNMSRTSRAVTSPPLAASGKSSSAASGLQQQTKSSVASSSSSASSATPALKRAGSGLISKLKAINKSIRSNNTSQQQTAKETNNIQRAKTMTMLEKKKKSVIKDKKTGSKKNASASSSRQKEQRWSVGGSEHQLQKDEEGEGEERPSNGNNKAEKRKKYVSDGALGEKKNVHNYVMKKGNNNQSDLLADIESAIEEEERQIDDMNEQIDLHSAESFSLVRKEPTRVARAQHPNNNSSSEEDGSEEEEEARRGGGGGESVPQKTPKPKMEAKKRALTVRDQK